VHRESLIRLTQLHQFHHSNRCTIHLSVLVVSGLSHNRPATVRYSIEQGMFLLNISSGKEMLLSLRELTFAMTFTNIHDDKVGPDLLFITDESGFI
jgi:hypothetical protein